jgi:hypothetical protein
MNSKRQSYILPLSHVPTGQLFHTEHFGNQFLVKSVLSMRRLTFPVGSRGLAGNPEMYTRYCLAPADSLASSL